MTIQEAHAARVDAENKIIKAISELQKLIEPTGLTVTHVKVDMLDAMSLAGSSTVIGEVKITIKM